MYDTDEQQGSQSEDDAEQVLKRSRPPQAAQQTSSRADALQDEDHEDEDQPREESGYESDESARILLWTQPVS